MPQLTSDYFTNKKLEQPHQRLQNCAKYKKLLIIHILTQKKPTSMLTKLCIYIKKKKKYSNYANMHNYYSFLFYFLIVFSLSCNSFSPSTLFLLYLLKSNKKFIQIIKIFKFILNLHPKFIRPPLKKKKKKNPIKPI